MLDIKITMAESLQPVKHRYNLKTRFEVVKSLGQGTYGKVKLAIDKKTGQKVSEYGRKPAYYHMSCFLW